MYRFLATGCELCADYVEKYPYYLSFVEEGFRGVTDKTFGRVEIFANKKPDAYAIDELRFLFKDNQDGNSKKAKEFRKFRDTWDCKYVSEEQLEKVKKAIKEIFYEVA